MFKSSEIIHTITTVSKTNQSRLVWPMGVGADRAEKDIFQSGRWRTICLNALQGPCDFSCHKDEKRAPDSKLVNQISSQLCH